MRDRAIREPMVRVPYASVAAIVVALCVFAGGARAAAPPTRADYLREAERGVARARAYWWHERIGWYSDRLTTPRRPAYLWSAFPLFEAVNAIAIASPTRANRAAAAAFGRAAERYWNPAVGGYAYLMGTNRRSVRTYFDDNGWWAVAFVDAYRATGDRRFLKDAARAFRFIVDKGWDPRLGGIWWDTARGHKTAEPLAAAAYAGAVLYRYTRDRSYLRDVRRMIRWADAHTRTRRSLYGRSATDTTEMDYVQGMMIGAHLELCSILRAPALCRKARALGVASLRAFPAAASWSPTADTIYLRFLLDLYRRDGDKRWYAVAALNARRAMARARDARGLYLHGWDGRRVRGGYLRNHAGTISLFAWLATVERR